jgi:hypothetical protein
MNEKITFTAKELQEESNRCVEAQQARIQAILKRKSEEIRREKFGRERENLAFQIATNSQKMREALICGNEETINEINQSTRAMLEALDLYDAEEYSYTETL